MNIKAIIYIIGFLIMLVGAFMLSALPFSFYFKTDDIIPILISSLITITIGLFLWLLTKNANDKEIKKREGYIIVSFGWIAMTLFGSLPFFIHGSIPSFTDAFFETMSGFTTTGASILTDIESLPEGLLYWRSLTQWLGGMGIIVLSLAILPILGIGGMQLFVAEVPGVTKDKIHPRIHETAKRLWGIYVIFTFTETILLMIGGMSFFDALNHSYTTMATGGFSTKNASIAHFQNPFIEYVIIIFMFLAGMSFSLHYFLLHKNFSVLKTNEEFKFYLYLIVGITILISLSLIISREYGIEKAFRDSLFQIVSLITTTGFVTADYEKWTSFSQIVFFCLLFIGGCAGSTGGGIKIVRHYLLLKNSILEFRRLIHPRAVIPVRMNNISINPEIVSNVLAFFLLYIIIFILGSIIMSILGVDFLTSIGSVATSIGNVGPGIGSVGPISNFSEIPVIGKWVLSFLMLVGRLEIFTVLIIFTPYFWKK